MGSKVGKILKSVAPLALSYFAPGLGTAIGTGLGAGASFAPIVGGAALGAGTGALTGGGKLSNILTGAIGGGLGGTIGSDTLVGRGLSDVGSALGDTVVGRGLSDVWGTSADAVTLPGIGKVGLGNGTGIKGAISNLSNGISSAAGGGASSFGGGSGNLFSNVLSAGLGVDANDSAEEDLLRAQQQALGAITPFANTEFTPDDLQNDAGYQFQLGQGEQALARKQAAGGNYFSGAALKEAQDYGTGLASKYYDQANTNFNNNRNFNYGVAQDQAGVFGNQGNIKANAGVNQNNILSNSLAGILGGAQQGKVIKGYDPKTGQPIYG